MDISLAIGSGCISWPGYDSFKIEEIKTLGDSFGYGLTKISMLTQTGTHIDAPSHYAENGASAAAIPLELFIGDARVLDLSSLEGSIISIADCMRAGEWPARVLLKTRASAEWKNERFPQDYPVLDEEAVGYLFRQGVKVVGTDTPSVDEFTSKSPLVHRWLAERDIYILESAYLYEVQEGYYELIALPLKIQGADGSPVRAVLRPLA